jgi:Na+/H+-dicarboxylate symporter
MFYLMMVIRVFEGQKTIVFWIGLIILGLASVGLFGILWMIAIWDGYRDIFSYFKYQVPLVVGGITFMLIGLYMMKLGVKKREE